MILGIGVDLACISRMQENIARYPQTFAQRILSASELIDFADYSQPANFLAKRFAAKEAFFKALGTGMRQGLSFSQISVVHDSLGKPSLSLTGRAQEMVDERLLRSIHLSLSDDGNYAIAYVILEG